MHKTRESTHQHWLSQRCAYRLQAKHAGFLFVHGAIIWCRERWLKPFWGLVVAEPIYVRYWCIEVDSSKFRFGSWYGCVFYTDHYAVGFGSEALLQLPFCLHVVQARSCMNLSGTGCFGFNWTTVYLYSTSVAVWLVARPERWNLCVQETVGSVWASYDRCEWVLVLQSVPNCSWC